MRERETPNGPSLSAFAALFALSVLLWFKIELAAALIYAVIIYLAVALISAVYRGISRRFKLTAEEKARREFLQRIQRDAEALRRSEKKKNAAVTGENRADQERDRENLAEV